MPNPTHDRSDWVEWAACGFVFEVCYLIANDNPESVF